MYKQIFNCAQTNLLNVTLFTLPCFQVKKNLLQKLSTFLKLKFWHIVIKFFFVVYLQEYHKVNNFQVLPNFLNIPYLYYSLLYQTSL